MKQYLSIEKICYLIGVVCLLCSCDSSIQKGHIINAKIGEVEGKRIVYDLYQTGPDNYMYEFYMLGLRDTTKLFVAYLNDATANNSRFELDEKNDTIEIRINKALGYQKKNINGKVVTLIGLENK